MPKPVVRLGSTANEVRGQVQSGKLLPGEFYMLLKGMVDRGKRTFAVEMPGDPDAMLSFQVTVTRELKADFVVGNADTEAAAEVDDRRSAEKLAEAEAESDLVKKGELLRRAATLARIAAKRRRLHVFRALCSVASGPETVVELQPDP